MAEPIIELVTFRLKPGADGASFRAAVARATLFLRRQDGFLGREVAVDAAGEWADIVRWASLDDALRAAALFNAAPETGDFVAMLDGPSVRVRHLRAIDPQGAP